MRYRIRIGVARCTDGHYKSLQNILRSDSTIVCNDDGLVILHLVRVPSKFLSTVRDLFLVMVCDNVF